MKENIEEIITDLETMSTEELEMLRKQIESILKNGEDE